MGAATKGEARHDQVQVRGMSTEGAGTGTQTWANWICEHKNKVKRETTTHQTHCRGRQG